MGDKPASKVSVETVSEDSVDEDPVVEESDIKPADSDSGDVGPVRSVVYERKPNGQLVPVVEK